MDSEDSMDSVLCVSGSNFIPSGFIASNCRESPLIFANSGGESIKAVGNFNIDIVSDCNFQGGDVLRTGESIICGGDIPSLYQSARYGNFSYQFTDLISGEYFVDLHFVEIVNTNGPKGIRIFHVFINEEKVLSELDIYSIVGANKPLQVVNIGVSVEERGQILIRFEGILGSPIISGICVKRAQKVHDVVAQKHAHIICDQCTAGINIPSSQSKIMSLKCMSKYEKKIAELNSQCQLKTNECYEAWMSLTAANKQLENVRRELYNKFLENMCLDQTMKKQAAELRDVSTRYEADKKKWSVAIDELRSKVKMMKLEHSQLSHEAHDCATSVSDINKMICAIKSLVVQYDDLKLKFNEEQEERKKFFNQVQDAKGNIRVFCRCRPLNKEEASAGYQMIVDFNAEKKGDLGIQTNNSSKKNFKFDRVYSPKDDQVDVFADVSPLVVSVLDGYNVCIFAYGQTGTGKTFTMEGTKDHPGVNYLTLQTLFNIAKERKETFKYDVSVSVLEVYNEQIRDLLAISSTENRLDIKQVSEGVHHVPGLVEAKVENVKEVWNVLQTGSNARAVGSNNVNEHSSRSHCMLRALVKSRNLIDGSCAKSKLWLVDLAGSERLSKTEVQGERLKEAQNINRSLSALGDVISALASKSSHIPYRNSKLTHLLQDSLAGDSKALMFVQISPSERDVSETLSSLNFATRVRGVELGLPKKQIDTIEVQKLKTTLDKTKQELRCKDEALFKLEENFQNLKAKAKGMDQLSKIQQEKVSKLESQLAMRTEFCGQLENQLKQLSEGMKEKEFICTTFQQKVSELENRMKERTHEFELHSSTLQQKIKELENKLAMGRDNSDTQLPQQKVKKIDEEPMERKETDYTSKLWFAEKLEITPKLTSSRRKSLSNVELHNQRSLSASNRATNQASNLLKGTDSLHDWRRKKDIIPSRGTENNLFLSNLIMEKKLLSPESSKFRLDSSKVLPRITASSSKPASSSTTQNANSKNHTRFSTGTRGSGSSNKPKFWLR